MDELGGWLSGLAGLAVLLVGGLFAFLLLTSQAVLVSEQKQADPYYGNYRCTYFTGTRTVDLYDNSQTGCSRLVPVGSE